MNPTSSSKRRRPRIVTRSWGRNLGDHLWTPRGPAQRSAELTPLYIDRYARPLHIPTMTAHDFWEQLCIFKGEGTLQCRRDFPFEIHTVLLIPPYMPHREESRETADCLWVGLRGTRLKSLDRDRVLHVKSAELAASFERLWLRAQNPFGRMGPELDGLTLVAFNEFLRRLDQTNPSTTDRISRAATYLRQHFDQEVAMSHVARQFGYSESYFYREFRKQAGTTPVQYLTDLRIKQALHWLRETQLTISRIAEMVGYRDPLYFRRVFQKVTGQRPSQMRHAYRPV